MTVDGRSARPSQRLRGGEHIALDLPPPVPAGLVAEDIPLDVVYEDAKLLVVNKPRGLVVHPAPGNPTGTLVNALLAHCPDLPGIGDAIRPGIVHRLDKDTTGLLVVAKDDPTMAGLSRQIAQHEVERCYLALVHGAPPAAFVVDAPLGRDPIRRQRIAVRPEDGRPARTHVRVLEAFARHALVEARLETGRTHQIRVHLQFAGFPVVADPVYGRRGTDALGLGGQALHAGRLTFVHPATGKVLTCEAPAPPDFLAALDLLRASDRADAPPPPRS